MCAPVVHTYFPVLAKERQRVLRRLSEVIAEDRRRRFALLIRAYNSDRKSHARPLQLVGSASAVTSKASRVDWHAAQIRRCQLLKDEDGIYWVLKRPLLLHNRIWRYGCRQNVCQREQLAYLLLRHISNQTEVRAVTKEDIRHSPAQAQLGDGSAEAYLLRLVLDGNMEFDRLPHRTARQAHSAIFVANVLIRKHDPFIQNLVPLRGVPVSIDNDFAFGFDGALNPCDSMHFTRFRYWFVGLTCLALINFGGLLDVRQASRDSATQRFADRVTIDILAMRRNPRKTLRALVYTLHQSGLPDAFMAASMLDVHAIRESIMQHKQVSGIRQTAMAAGYRGRKLAGVVAMIRRNGQTLGRDVNEVLQDISGKDYRLDRMDQGAGPLTS